MINPYKNDGYRGIDGSITDGANDIGGSFSVSEGVYRKIGGQ